jgi:uncharacterized protein YbaP (TraB family)
MPPTLIQRRTFLWSLGALGVSLRVPRSLFASEPPTDPILWVVHKDNAKVYVFGFDQYTKGRSSWFTPKVERAFNDSTTIWFEGSPPFEDTSHEAPDPITQLTTDPTHSLFDQLGPELSARVLAAAKRYGVARADLEHERMWHAYFVLNRGYIKMWASKDPNSSEFVDEVLAQMAKDKGKIMKSEYQSENDVVRLFVQLSDQGQRERMGMLLDYYDDEHAGRLDPYGWLYGRSNATIERMRVRSPVVYQEEQVRRNWEWAERIVGMLNAGGTYFIPIGNNHTRGPESLLAKVALLGYPATQVPKE